MKMQFSGRDIGRSILGFGLLFKEYCMTTFSDKFIRGASGPVRSFAAFLAVFTLFGSMMLMPGTAVSGQGKGAKQKDLVFAHPSSPQTSVCSTTAINIPSVGPASPYPSALAVSGITGTITDLNVKLVNFSHTYPADVAMLLVSPDGTKKFVLQSDTGGGTDVSNLTYTIDDQAANDIPENGPMPPNNGSVRPTSIGDDDGMPPPAPAEPYSEPAPAGSATLNGVFGGVDPNGTWNLFVIDFFSGDAGSISGGYCLDITTNTSPAPSDAVVDINGDGMTDWVVVRNTGGGTSGQTTWYTALSNNVLVPSVDWGIASDQFVPADYDGDQKDDIAIFRSDAQGKFIIIQSLTSTMRIEELGQAGDDATVVGDYNGDNKDDVAVYRSGTAPGSQSFWYYKIQGAPYFETVAWGQAGDFPAPGDYDGDNKNDFVVQRADTNGTDGRFFLNFSGGGQTSQQFGLADDSIAPGDYDGDKKTDLAVVRSANGFLVWDFEPSGTAGITVVRDEWGVAATDLITQGDYDGDGKTDYAVWRPGSPSMFYVMTPVTRHIFSREWGQANDYPVANFNVH